MGRILLVDDEPGTLHIVASRLQEDGHTLWRADRVEKALEYTSSNRFDAIFTKQKLLDGEGLKVLTAAREADPTISVVFLTAAPLAGFTASASQQGAFAFLSKPSGPEEILVAARRACEYTSCRRENLLLRAAVEHSGDEYEICGETTAIREVRQAVAYLGPTDSAVLITGEQGSGKEVVARAILHSSTRAAKPLIAQSCIAVEVRSFEDHLFGQSPGNSGRELVQHSLLEAGNEGTIYLKDIEGLSLSSQERLTRVLTEGRILRAGQSHPSKIDVRIIASTSRDLQQRVKDSSFREDLLKKLNAVHIHLPSLRERREDIPLLCEFFSQRIASERGLQPRTVNAEAIARLGSYPFPGNVAELRNMIERAYMLRREGEIQSEDLPLRADREFQDGELRVANSGMGDRTPENFDLLGLLKKTELDLIRRTLASTGGSQAEAARRMGISRSLLSYKINKYGIRAAD
jgi:two-component system, NtrC family, response regulator